MNWYQVAPISENDNYHETQPAIAQMTHHTNVARLEFDVVGDFSGSNVDLDAVLGFDQRIGVSEKQEL